MSTNVASVTSHFPSPQNNFATTLASDISAGAATVPLNSVLGYTNGQTAVFVIEPGTASQQTFTGVVNTGTVSITSVVWTAGTNVTHTGGVTVVDYASATHIAMMSKGMLVSHNQDGTIKTGAVSSSSMIGNGIVTHTQLASGVALQAATSATSAVATGTTIIPFDDTIPQNTEGDQYMTVSITPKATSNLLVVEAVFVGSHSIATDVTVALFQDTTANALAVSAQYQATAGGRCTVALQASTTAASTSATTFKIRAGGGGAGTLTFNGTGGARLFGTASKSFIKVTEYKA